MVLRFLSLLLLLVGSLDAKYSLQLTPSNWDDKTYSKTVFILYKGSGCGACKSIQPTWDLLMEDYEFTRTMVVGEVDCSGDGKDLCEKHGVTRWPTILYNDANDLKVYLGGHSYGAIRNFTMNAMQPICAPYDHTYYICSEKEKGLIRSYGKLSIEELDAKIAKATEFMEVDVPIMNQVIEYLEDMGLDGSSGEGAPEEPAEREDSDEPEEPQGKDEL